MALNSYVAEKRRAIFADLQNGQPPSEGDFDAHLLSEARGKGSPQMGSTRYEPHAILIEFIYPDPRSSPTVFTVTLAPPERIVFLSVPEWVIESIWQGEIDGSYHFESDAHALIDRFVTQLEPESNLEWFQRRQAKRRE